MLSPEIPPNPQPSFLYPSFQTRPFTQPQFSFGTEALRTPVANIWPHAETPAFCVSGCCLCPLIPECASSDPRSPTARGLDLQPLLYSDFPSQCSLKTFPWVSLPSLMSATLVLATFHPQQNSNSLYDLHATKLPFPIPLQETSRPHAAFDSVHCGHPLFILRSVCRTLGSNHACPTYTA